MSPEVIALLLAALFFTGALGHAVASLRQGQYQAAWPGVVLMAGGFVCQCVFLQLRGSELGRCPVTTPFELLNFVSWAMVLLYFATGPAYRLSLMGAFTAPLALGFVLLGLAKYAPAVVEARTPNFRGEMHAALALMSYGAMALACVAGIMFLVMDRLLKRHTRGGLVWKLPPIHHLSLAIRRLILAATLLLTASIAGGMGLTEEVARTKLAVVYIIWVVYAALLSYEWWRGMSARRAAWAAVLAFSLPVASLWIVSR